MKTRGYPRYAKCKKCVDDIIYAPSAGSGFDRSVWLHSVANVGDAFHQAEPVPGTERAPEPRSWEERR